MAAGARVAAGAAARRRFSIRLLPMAVEPAAPVVAMVASPAATLQPDAVPVVDTRDEEPLAAAASVAPALFVEPAEPPRADLQPWVPSVSCTLAGSGGARRHARGNTRAASRAAGLDRADRVAASGSQRRPRPSDGASAQPRRVATPPKPTPKAAKPVQDEWDSSIPSSAVSRRCSRSSRRSPTKRRDPS